MNEKYPSPSVSKYVQSLKPSDIRIAQFEFDKRTDGSVSKNVALGNVSMSAHPAIQQGVQNLGVADGYMNDGVHRYSATVAIGEAVEAVRKTMLATDCNTDGLHIQVTDGGSQAMERMLTALCGDPGAGDDPLLTLDPTYTNYGGLADRLGRKIVSITRYLQENGEFTLPDLAVLKRAIEETRAKALLIIPCDNPTGHFINQDAINEIAEVCRDTNTWLVSDEAYRGLNYNGEDASSVWKIPIDEIPGIEGRRISIESFSKVGRACGVHMGAAVTDREDLFEGVSADQSINLCANVLGQYAIKPLAEVSVDELRTDLAGQREYYKHLIDMVVMTFREEMSGLIVSNPDSALYSTLDVRRIVKPGFDAKKFVLYCAKTGGVDINGKKTTLLTAPMEGFYQNRHEGLKQMRIAYVLSPEDMMLVPGLFNQLLHDYERGR